MSTSPTPAPATSSASAVRSKKVLVPKVWKRPHSTIYGKNVEFGSSLYSDKIGELNGRKFNSELPWTVRNSGSSIGTGTASNAGSYNQGYLSNLLLLDPQSSTFNYHDRLYSRSSGSSGNSRGLGSSLGIDDSGASLSYSGDYENPFKLALANCKSYADLLELTNPNRYSRRNKQVSTKANKRMPNATKQPGSDNRSRQSIDFYDQYLNNDFYKNTNINYSNLNYNTMMSNNYQPTVLNELTSFSNLSFDPEIGLFIANQHNYHDSRDLKFVDRFNDNDDHDMRRLRNSIQRSLAPATNRIGQMTVDTDNNQSSFVPLSQITQQTKLLPKHKCQLMSSPYGTSADGRKLSLGSINPQSYRPSLPQKTTTAHASDGEEFEFHDKSSPFYTDRWAGKTIRHFDSDLYSNANLFKSMIL